VTELVLARLQQIPKAQRILYWHHCLLEAYRYLSFRHL
jgi:hypothetical protein